MTNTELLEIKQDMLKNILRMMNQTHTREELNILRNAWRSLNEIDHIIINRIERERSDAYARKNERLPERIRGFQELRSEKYGHVQSYH